MERLPRKLAIKNAKKNWRQGFLLSIVMVSLCLFGAYKISLHFFSFEEPDKKASGNVKIKKSNSLNRGKIVILVTDLGLNNNISAKVENLTYPIVMGLSAYTPTLSSVINRLHNIGKEVLVSIPMQTYSYYHIDPGPYALSNFYSQDENKWRLGMLYKISQKADGFYANEEEIFTRYKDNAILLVNFAKNKNKALLYFDPRKIKLLEKISQRKGYNKIKQMIVKLDTKASPEAMSEKFSLLELIAKSQGKVIGFMKATPYSVNYLEKWLNSLSSKQDIELVTLEEYIKDKG